MWLAIQTRILVTHGMSFLPQADLILVLVDGEITESGSYQELLSRHGAFADFIHTFANTERKESAIQRGTERTGKTMLGLFLLWMISHLCKVVVKSACICISNICVSCSWFQEVQCSPQYGGLHAVLQRPVTGAAHRVRKQMCKLS